MSASPDNFTPVPTPPRMRPPRRRIWPTLLLACLVFIAGTGFGAAATIIVAVHRVRYAIQHPEQAPARLARELKRRLALDEPQTAAVQRILETRQKRLQLVRKKVQPQVDTEMEATRTEIAEVLRPGQKQKWNASYDEIKANWMPPAPPP